MNETFNELIKKASIERGLATQEFAKRILEAKPSNTIKINCTDELISGVREVSEVVNSTLGPNGRLVLFNEGGEVKATKDGVTVAKSIKISDQVKDMAAKLLLQAASKTAQEVGDGTTTTCIYTSAILDNLTSTPISNFNEVQNGMDRALSDIKKLTNSYKKDVDLDTLKKVLFVSSNNNSEISESITDIYSKLDKWDIDFLFHETMNHTDSIELELGYEISHKSPNISFKTVKDNVGVILLNYKPTAIGTNLARAMEAWSFENKLPLVFICRDFSPEFINDLTNHSLRYSMPLYAVRLDLYGPEADNQMKDISYATSAEIIESVPMNPLNLDVVGTVKTAIFSMDKTNFIFDEPINEYTESLEESLKDLKDEVQKYNLLSRISKLKGVTANYYVGGRTTQEMQERYYRIEDAIKAAGSAVRQGVILGGGYTNIKIYSHLKDYKEGTKDLNLGYNSVINSLLFPFMYLCKNSYIDNSEYVDLIDYISNSEELFNFQTLEYEKISETNIYDPAAASIVALEGAISVTSTILLTKTVIL